MTFKGFELPTPQDLWLQIGISHYITHTHTHVDTHPPHVYGRTCFHDNVQDEWLIVYLLFELCCYHPDLVVMVTDSDGQFLLIEAAHHLPKWLKPETSENRVSGCMEDTKLAQ